MNWLGLISKHMFKKIIKKRTPQLQHCRCYIKILLSDHAEMPPPGKPFKTGKVAFHGLRNLIL